MSWHRAQKIPVESDPELVTLFLAGDVMTGRGVDQILPHPCGPELRESCVDSARTYVELAEHAHGRVPAPVDPSYIWGDGREVLERFMPAASIVNLETSITVSNDFWPRKAVHYRMHPQNVRCLEAAGIDVCALANNHVLDFGRSGLMETIQTLRAAGIQSVGAGHDLEEARGPVRIAVGRNAAVLVFAFGSVSSGIPYEWAAGPSRPGVHLISDLSAATANDITDRIRRNKQPGDIVITSIHWGSNWGYELSPEHTKFAHALICGGVDVVHGHSSHHVRPVEIHDRKLILYGCGDLVTDYEGIRGHEEWRGDLGAMYLATISARDGTLMHLRVAPMQMRRMRLARPSSDDVAQLQTTLNRISRPFGIWFEREEPSLLVLRDGALE